MNLINQSLEVPLLVPLAVLTVTSDGPSAPGAYSGDLGRVKRC